MLTSDTPVNTLGPDLKARYGHRLRRVMLDLGLTCPNRDGESGYGGCIYCDLDGSGTGAMKQRRPLLEQWQEQLKRIQRSDDTGGAIIYFQSYSNTYPDLLPLARALETMAPYSETAPVVSVGTRPDCFSPEAAALLGSYRDRFSEVWVEFGLETADDRVQKLIGRHDSLRSFHRACELAREHGISIIAHTICGLPGEAKNGLQRQVEEISIAGCAGIKFHQLMVLRKTKLEHLWRQGKVDLLTTDEYVSLVADALEILPPNIVVHRLVAENPAENYLAPSGWPSRAKVHHLIESEMRHRGSFQGCRRGYLVAGEQAT